MKTRFTVNKVIKSYAAWLSDLWNIYSLTQHDICISVVKYAENWGQVKKIWNFVTIRSLLNNSSVENTILLFNSFIAIFKLWLPKLLYLYGILILQGHSFMIISLEDQIVWWWTSR